MKRRPCCGGERGARREKQCSDWEKAWDLTLASAFPTCAHWRCWPHGRGTQSRPSTTCARQQGWPQSSACQQNSGRFRRYWEGCIGQEESKNKRTQRLGRRRRSSRGWRRASGMRRCVRAFWLGHRFNRCCNKLVTTSTRSRKTTHSRYSVEVSVNFEIK